MRKSMRVKRVQSLLNSCFSAITNMVVGGNQNVEAGIAQCIQKVVRRVEIRPCLHIVDVFGQRQALAYQCF